MDFYKYFHIIPVGDGYSMLGKNEYGEYFLKEKACEDRDFVLVFPTEEDAQDYIDANLNPGDWAVEYFLTTKELEIV